MDKNPDKLLLERLKKGDAKALKEAHDRYHKSVLNAAYLQLNNAASVEDIKQDVFTALWNNREKIEVNIALLPYLLAMAKNKAIDLLRDQKRQENLAKKNKDRMQMVELPNNDLETKEGPKMMLAALKKVASEKIIQAFELVYIYGLKTKEAAEIMGTTAAVIREYLKRARTILRSVLKKSY
jgi:RNA polymerase sigma factor (sigma-70 family)